MNTENTTHDNDSDDAEGHAFKRGLSDEATTINTQDTTGHLAKSGRVTPAEDAEGHAFRRGSQEPDGADDDAEGHAATSKH